MAGIIIGVVSKRTHKDSFTVAFFTESRLYIENVIEMPICFQIALKELFILNVTLRRESVTEP